MFIRYKFPRAVSAVIAALALTVSLSSCYGIDMQYAPSVEPPPPVDSEETPSQTADPEVVRFADLLGQILTAVPENSGALSSNPLDILFRPVLQKDAEASEYTYVKMHLTEPNTPESGITLSSETIWNTDTGDASFVAYNQTGAETPEQAGIWFAGNRMTIKKSLDQKPILQHTLTPQVAQSMRMFPAFERFMHVLGDTGAAVLSQESWDAAVADYLKTIIDNGRAPDLSATNGTDTFGGVQVPTVSEKLKIGGARGVSAVRGLLLLLGKDAELKALFNTQFFTDGTQYGITGLDGALRDIDALGDDDISAAIATFQIVETDRPAGVLVTLNASGKSLTLDLTFYDRGPVSQNDILFGGFDGSRVVISRLVTLSGGGGFSANFTYDALSPGAQPQENITVLSSGTISDDALDVTAQLSMTRAASPASGALIIGATLSYNQTADGATAQGTGAGVLNISDGGTAYAYQYDLSLIETNEAVQVTPPVFSETSGLSTVTQDGLYGALGAFDGKSFVLAPPTMRFQAIFTLLFK